MTDRQGLALRTILLWVLLELTAAAQVVNSTGVSVLRSWTRVAVSPLTGTASWLSETTGDLFQGIRDFSRVIADLRTLREEVQSLRARNILLREDLETLREAQRTLPLTQEFAGPSRIARCSFRNLGLGLMQVHSEAGSTVLPNTVALSGEGLVGRVMWSGGGSSWVQLITHPAAAVAVRTADGTVHGLAAGSSPDRLDIQYISRTADLVRGTVLVTSGADGIYPPGIPAAQITSVRETNAAFLEVRGAPAVDLATVRVVLLLPEWVRSDGPEETL